MTGGLTSSSSFQFGPHRSSSLQDLLNFSRGDSILSPNFYQSIMLPAPAPSPHTTNGLDPALLNYHARSPTATSTISTAPSGTSPPLLHAQQRRLSLASVNRNSGMTTSPYAMTYESSNSQRIQSMEIGLFAQLDSLDSLNIPNRDNHGPAFLNSFRASFQFPPTSTGRAGASAHLINNDSRNRSLSESNTSINSAAATVIAEHRRRAEQAAREHDAEQAATRPDTDTPLRSRTRSGRRRYGHDPRNPIALHPVTGGSDPNPFLNSATKRNSSYLTDDELSAVEGFEMFNAASPGKKRKSSTRLGVKKAPVDEDSVSCRPSCAVCMSEPSREELATIDVCSHMFCFDCICKWADRENTCPLCKSRFAKVTRVHMQRKKKNGPSVHNTKRVKQRDQRSDIATGPNIEGLLATIANNGLPPDFNGQVFVTTQGGSATFMRILQRPRRQNFSIDSIMGGDSSSEDDDGAIPFMGFLSQPERSRFAVSQQQTSPRTRSAWNALSSLQPSFPVGSSLSRVYAQRTGGSSTSARAPSLLAAYHNNLRSHATNSSDPSAGHAVNNPLEIGDDDSDNDSVQVVQVVSTTASM